MGQRTGGRARRLLLAAIVSGALLAQNASAAQGDISTVAGGGIGDGGPATGAAIGSSGVAVDTSGNVFIADTNNHRVRKVNASGTITTVAGTGTQGFSGDAGPATSASLNSPYGIAVDTAGNLFIADAYNLRVRKVDASGTITTVAGTGTQGFSGDGGPATSASLKYPSGVAVDTSGNLFIADTYNHRVRKVDASGTITTVAGYGTYGFSGDGGPATSARLYYPSGVAVDTSGNLFIGDSGNNRIRKVGASGTITTVAGTGTYGFSGDGGPATGARLRNPRGVAVDSSGNLFIADIYNHRVRKVDASGKITSVAGNGTYGFSGDGGPATGASLRSPSAVAVNTSGNLFIADTDNRRVRKVGASGKITTVAGNGTETFSGDGGPATNASLRSPYGVAVDTSGNLFIADTDHNRIRKVGASGTITTVAGDGTYGFSGDGGPATSAQLSYPRGVAVDTSGNLFIVDAYNNRVRKVDASGKITSVAGNGTSGFSGDGGPATSAQLSYPYGVAVDTSGNLFIADSGNNRVRQVDASGTITTVAGAGQEIATPESQCVSIVCVHYLPVVRVDRPLGDGGPAVAAKLSYPLGVAVDPSGNLFIADSGHNRVRKVDASGTITTVVGTGIPDTRPPSEGPCPIFSLCVPSRPVVTVGPPLGDGGPAVAAKLRSPTGVTIDDAGNLFIADTGNNRVRRVDASGTITTVAGDGADDFSGDGGPATSARLSYPYGVAVDTSGNLFIADKDNNRIRKVAAD